MPQAKLPYELLARWEGSALLGVSIRWINRITDDQGNILSSVPTDPQHVTLAQEQGFPLADALAALNTAAIARGDTLQGQLDVANASLATATTDLATRTEERDQARAQVAQLTAALEAANAPLPANVISSLAFFDRFTDAEYASIDAGTAQNIQLKRWMMQALAAQQIDLSDQRVKDGVNALATAGLITPARAVEILTP